MKGILLKNVISLTLVIVVLLFCFDPVFTRTVSIGDYSASYEWRIFNNVFCNIKSAGHCFDNDANKLNAEIEVCRNALNTVDGLISSEKELVSIVEKRYRLFGVYRKLTKSENVQIDSLIKYKNDIFQPIRLK